MGLDRTSFSTALASGAAASATAITFSAPCKLKRIMVQLPNWTGNVSGSLTVINDKSMIVYQTALLAKNTKTSIPVDVEVYPTDILEIEDSADHATANPAVSATGYVYLEGL